MTVDTYAPAPLTEAVEVADAGGSRRTVLVAGGVAAALALGAAGYFLLSGGSDTATDAGAPVTFPHAVQPAAKAPVKPAAKKPVVKVPAVSTVPLGRDPFKALYLLPVVTSNTTGTNTTPTTVTPPTTSGGTTTPVQPAQPTTTAPKVYKLVLTRVDNGTVAVFSVGGKTMLAKVGSVFGPTSEIKLVYLTQDAKGVWVATIQVGDGDPVDAPKGQTLYVR
jgi:hypothetical protein